MLEKIIDLHIHSKYSRACSKNLELPKIAVACEEKGIDIVSTGDFTHPLWLAHMEESLEEVGNSGLFQLKNSQNRTRFIIGTEIACIYKHKEKVRRLHIMIYAPSFDVARKFIGAMEERGVNLRSDGRPIMGIQAKEIVQICSQIDERVVVIPAHTWTPWFSVFGSKSGYDSLEECFEEMTPKIFAVETGLSSDPPMNRRLKQLDSIALVSNSDAHSLEKLGREANVLAFENEAEVNYQAIWEIIKSGDKKRFLYTIEFYPEEGMYHFDGHRSCAVSMTPIETIKAKEICPKCKKKLTVGVLSRVEKLADRSELEIPENFIPHRYSVPLREIIAGCFGVGVQSKRVEKEYRLLLQQLGSEFSILLHLEIAKIAAAASDPGIALGIQKMRSGTVKVVPGYDGVYGKVEIYSEEKVERARQVQLI